MFYGLIQPVSRKETACSDQDKRRRVYLQRSYCRGVGVGKENHERESTVTGGKDRKHRGMFTNLDVSIFLFD